MRNLSLYVCQLPEEKRLAVLKKAEEELKSLAYDVDLAEELENVDGSKLSDLSDLLGYGFLKNL